MLLSQLLLNIETWSKAHLKWLLKGFKMIPRLTFLGKNVGRYEQFSIKIMKFYHFLHIKQSISQLIINLETYS